MLLKEIMELTESDNILNLKNSISLRDINAGKFFKYDKINIEGSLELEDIPYEKLPWKFGKVSSTVTVSFNKTLNSLENLPEWTNRIFIHNNNNITSLVGIHKIIKHCTRFDMHHCPVVEGGLGLLLIDGLTQLSVYGINKHTSDTEARLQQAFKIIAKYLGQGKKGIILCQSELIEKGYEEYAKL